MFSFIIYVYFLHFRALARYLAVFLHFLMRRNDIVCENCRNKTGSTAVIGIGELL